MPVSLENFKKMIPYEKPDIDIVESTFRYIKNKVILKAEINNNGTRNDLIVILELNGGNMDGRRHTCCKRICQVCQ